MFARLMREVRCACLWMPGDLSICLCMMVVIGFPVRFVFSIPEVTSKKFTTRTFASAVIFKLIKFVELFSCFICQTC
jgi:hypothetical protein